MSAQLSLVQEDYRELEQPNIGIWDVAVSLGVPRPVMGKWIKMYGEYDVAEMIAHMSLKRPADPVSYGTACLQKRLRVPDEDNELMPWAEANGLPKPDYLETYHQYRKRLWKIVRERNGA